jgi:phosphoglycerol transferase
MDSKRDRLFGRDLYWPLLTGALTVLAPFYWFGSKFLGYSGLIGGSGDLLLPYVISNGLAHLRFPIDSQYGFPSGLNWGYFPSFDWLNALPAALIDHFYGLGRGLALVYLISFPVTFVFAYYCGREIKLSTRASTVVALSATILPWHFFRFMHFDFATSYGLFAGILLALRQFNIESNRLKFGISKTDIVLIAVVVLSGPYFVAFTLIFLFAAFMFLIAKDRTLATLFRATISIGVSTLFFMLSQLPFALARYSTSPLSNVTTRSLSDSILYGGRPLVLFVPTHQSHIPIYSQILNKLPLVPISTESESISNYGVLLTTLGFLIITVYWFLKLSGTKSSGSKSVDRELRIRQLTWLFGVGILMFLTWGPNLLFARFVTPQVRGWNRLTPDILLLVLLLAAKILEGAVGWRLPKLLKKKYSVSLLTLLAILVVLFDQLPTRGSGASLLVDGTTRTILAKQYVKAIESKLPMKCPILQLPVVPFPENPPVNQMSDYEHFLPSLFDSNKLWTYGAIKNTSDYSFQSDISGKSAKAILQIARQHQMCGVHIDLRGYSNNDFFNEMTAILGTPSVRGYNGEWAFFVI